MTEPDYSRYSLEELQDTLKHINATQQTQRYSRLLEELKRRENEPTPTYLAEAARVKRKQLFAQWAAIGGIAGAFSLPISLVFLGVLLQANSGLRKAVGLFEPLAFFGGVPLGWILGVTGGVCWAALRVRQEEREVNTIEVWRDALSAVISLWLGGCFLWPLVFVMLALLMGFVFMFILWLQEFFS